MAEAACDARGQPTRETGIVVVYTGYGLLGRMQRTVLWPLPFRTPSWLWHWERPLPRNAYLGGSGFCPCSVHSCQMPISSAFLGVWATTASGGTAGCRTHSALLFSSASAWWDWCGVMASPARGSGGLLYCISLWLQHHTGSSMP